MIDFEILPTALLFIAGAIPNTLFMAFVIIIASIVFGSLIAVLRLRGGRLLNGIFTVLISFFRAVPGIVQLFIVYNSLPFLLAPIISAVLGHTVKLFDVSPYWTVYATFILYNTAYQSENIRGALRSVDQGICRHGYDSVPCLHPHRPAAGFRRGASDLLHLLPEDH
mgnify:CR=1 FL=1